MQKGRESPLHALLGGMKKRVLSMRANDKQQKQNRVLAPHKAKDFLPSEIML